MEKISYLGQPNCFRLSNGLVEVIVSTDIGLRVLRYGFCGRENLFAEVPELVTKTRLGDWKPWGGHQTYTTRNYMEVESLGPLHNLAPGESAEHVEEWFLFRDVKVDGDEKSPDAAVRPLIAELNLRTDKEEDNQ